MEDGKFWLSHGFQCKKKYERQVGGNNLQCLSDCGGCKLNILEKMKMAPDVKDSIAKGK
jgi:hypothetical protein